MPGPPGCGLGDGLMSHPCKKSIITVTVTRHAFQDSSWQRSVEGLCTTERKEAKCQGTGEIGSLYWGVCYI